MNTTIKKEERDLFKSFENKPEIVKTSSYPNNSIFFNRGVKHSKKRQLKDRLRTLIRTKKMSESEFYNSIGISRQYWYFISWGIWDCPLDLKFKIAGALSVDSAMIWEREK